MLLSDFDYHLPREFIAQTPLEPRDSARLMVLARGSGEWVHSQFSALGDWLRAGDVLVLNDTRVMPARLPAWKPTGGKAEVLLLRRLSETRWVGLVGGKNIPLGMTLLVAREPSHVAVTVVEDLVPPQRIVEFSRPIDPYLHTLGQVPLPPYIHTPLTDQERYQTVFAKSLGSAAAPTAGLHFTPDLLQRVQNRGVEVAYLTLHVGLDTFQPMTVTDVREHPIHREWCALTEETAEQLRAARARGGRVIAVGTTSARVLETAAQSGEVVAWEGDTRLFITPGFRFHAIDALITNFHLPKSSLLLLVSAFLEPNGREKLLRAYQAAQENRYRFFSFGDAMFIA